MNDIDIAAKLEQGDKQYDHMRVNDHLVLSVQRDVDGLEMYMLVDDKANKIIYEGFSLQCLMATLLHQV